jgi:hypothetical protein
MAPWLMDSDEAGSGPRQTTRLLVDVERDDFAEVGRRDGEVQAPVPLLVMMNRSVPAMRALRLP